MPLHTPQAVIPVPSGPGCVLCKECVTEKGKRKPRRPSSILHNVQRGRRNGGGGNNDRTESPADSHASSTVKYERRTVDWLVKAMPKRDQRVIVKSSLRVNGEIDLGSPC